MGRHVFISHAREDKSRIRPVIDQLLKQGLTIWIDKPREIELHRHPNVKGIKSYENWAKSIKDNLNDAGVVILFWSRHSVEWNRRYIHEEGHAAMQRNVLVQVAIDPIFDNGPGLPFGFSQNHVLPIVRELEEVAAGLKAEPDVSDLVGHILELLSKSASSPSANPAGQTGGQPAPFGATTFLSEIISSTALDDPLPYMVDRQIQQNHIVSNLCAELKQGERARPCVFLLPAPDQERPDKFIDYIQYEVFDELREEGNLGRNFEWDIRHLDLPAYPGGTGASSYFGPMIDLENFERSRQDGRSRVAEMMVRFGDALPNRGEGPPSTLPLSKLVDRAEAVRTACIELLGEDFAN